MKQVHSLSELQKDMNYAIVYRMNGAKIRYVVKSDLDDRCFWLNRSLCRLVEIEGALQIAYQNEVLQNITCLDVYEVETCFDEQKMRDIYA